MLCVCKLRQRDKKAKTEVLRRGGSKDSSLDKIEKLEMRDINKNLGREWHCYCGQKETTEYISDCEKVKEVIRKKAKKEWLAGEKVKILLK